MLKWNATYETGFKQYEIERSTDGSVFNKIGSVQGRNSANYNFTDDRLPRKQVIYYRLKMLDIDGKFTYSKTLAVKLENYFSQALVYPNPTSGNLHIRLLEQLEGNSSIQVTDITGRIVRQETIKGGMTSIRLSVGSLPEGRYFIKIFNATQLINDSFVIVK